MKYILIALVLVGVYVFLPTYDLYIGEDSGSFTNKYKLEETGFYSKSACEAASESYTESSYGRLSHRCRKTSKWSAMYGNYTKYDPSIRETRKQMEAE